MQKIVECIKKFFGNKTNIFVLIFIILNAILTVYMAEAHDISSIKVISIILAAELVLEIGLIFLYRYLEKKGAPLEKKFLGLLLPLGVFFIIIMPPGKTPDSFAHTARAFDVSQGSLITGSDEEGHVVAELPVEFQTYRKYEGENISYVEQLKTLGPRLSGETYSERGLSAADYNFIIYLPHALGMFIGRALNLPLILILDLGRLFSLLVFAAFAYFAIKITPRYKTLFAFIGLFPMTIQLVTAYSADAMTFAVSFLLVAYAFSLIYRKAKSPLSHKEIAFIYILAILMGLCKFVYLPLCALFLLVPYKTFGNKKRKWLNAACAAIIAGGIAILWILIQPSRSGSVLNGSENTDFIFAHPIHYLGYIFATIADQFTGFYLSSTFGVSLGGWKFTVPDIYFYLALIFSVLVLSRGIERPDIKPSARLVALICLGVPTFAFMTAMYTQWTKPGMRFVDGVQGRYFIPLLTTVPLLLTSSKQKPTLDHKYPLLFNAFFVTCSIACIFIGNL